MIHFFPTLEKEGITTIVDMGDTFDSRKGVDFSSLHGQKIITMIVYREWVVRFIL